MNTNEINTLKRDRLRLEHECSSIRDRIRDIEWRIQMEDSNDVAQEWNQMMDERQRALDKLRKTSQDLLDVKEKMVANGIDT